ncbi:MAG: ferric reductase-like transmembrane domain-containing protein [Anaerolineales bacterium]
MQDSKRLRRHIFLALIAAMSVAMIFVLLGFSPERWPGDAHGGMKAEMWNWRASMSLAYVALAYLVAALIIGPLHVLRHATRPANNMLRRDVGIWAAGLALCHMLIALTVHAPDGWKFWWYFIQRAPSWSNPLPLQWNMFGLANYAGLAQAGILGFLLLLSNNIALRRLGVPRWKSLQRLSYLAFALVFMHTLAYQSIEERLVALRAAVWAALGLTLILQAAGAWAVLRRSRHSAQKMIMTQHASTIQE